MRFALCAYSYEPPAIDLNYPNDPNKLNDLNGINYPNDLNGINDPNELNDPNEHAHPPHRRSKTQLQKIAPLYHALKKEDWAVPIIVHTGQHYDLNMSNTFFQDLRLPEPDLHLGVGSGTHAL